MDRVRWICVLAGIALAVPVAALGDGLPDGPSPSEGAGSPSHLPWSGHGTIFAEETAFDGGPATLIAIDPEGSGEREVVKDPRYACCDIPSPDGTRVAFLAGTSDQRATTALVHPDGSGYYLMDAPDAPANIGPDLWLSATDIVFTEWSDADASLNGLYLGDPTDPGSIRRLTRNDVGASDAAMGVSADGRRIAFVRSPKDSPNGDLWTVDLEGVLSGPFNPPGTTVDAEAYWGNPVSWSPDGDRLAFPATTATCGRCDVHVADADGSGTRQVAATMGTVVGAHWSPDGQWIYYEAGQPGAGQLDQIWRVHPDGTGTEVVSHPADGGGAWDPQFSPDGTRMVFDQGVAPGLDLWTADLDGSDPVQVTHHPGNHFEYHWAP